MNDVLAELQAELQSVAPSPEFAARVRARIESEARGARFRVWALVACAAAVIAAVALISRGLRGVDTLPAAPRIATAAAQPAPAPSVRSVRPALQPRHAAAPVTRGRRPRVDVSARTDARFDVITTQAAVLQQLWRHATRLEEEPAEAPAMPEAAASVDADGRLIVRELVVDPIVVPPIGGGPGGQGRVQRLLSPQATGSPK